MKILPTIKYTIIALICFVSLLPFYVLLYLSLNTPSGEHFQSGKFLPDFHFENYVNAWQTSHIGLAIMNSIIITFGSLVIVVLFASAAGYAIARFRNKFHIFVFNLFLISMMIPGIIITVPLYILMHSIGGMNTHWAMILLLSANAMPLSIFLYTNFIRLIPREIEESAIIDGCSYFTVFWRITFHFLKPVTAAVVILIGLSIWNNYAQAVFFLQKQSMQTIPLAISLFFQQYGAKWNLMAASAVISVIPATLAFIMFQRYFIKGMIAGAVKG